MVYDPKNNRLVDLLKNGVRHPLPKAQVLQVTDRSSLFLVQTGYIKRYQITNSGTQSIQSVYGPGQIFPLTPVFQQVFEVDINHGVEIYYYEATVPTSVYSISRNELADAISKEPLLYKDILYVSSERLNSNIQRLNNIALVNAHRRVAHQLAYFAEVFGEATDEGVVIKFPLTHQELAAVLNMARETVSHVLGRLRDKGLIDASHKNIIIVDLEKLMREAR